ncbi:MAG TPA: hypothetical protein VKT82_19805 [Ktedonobacterales bacterium]|nr:hypothetical protein [Ktedonobacterales bacterium]
MMVWVTYSIQWIHEFLGIFWFGGVLYLNFVVIPAITKQPLEQQRQISGTLSRLSDRLFKPISILVIIFGILRGTIWGPIQSWSFLFGTGYGWTFIVALLTTVGLVLWGTFVTGRSALKLNDYPVAEVAKGEGPVAAAYTAQLQRVKLFALLELLGFLVVFSCMVLLAFGM